jgi:hypothetical protein
VRAREVYQIQRHPYPRRSAVRYAFHVPLTVVTDFVFRIAILELDVEIVVNDAAFVPFTTGPSPSPGEGPSSGFQGMGLAKACCGTEATRASEHRRIPNNKKRRGIRILMPAPKCERRPA